MKMNKIRRGDSVWPELIGPFGLVLWFLGHFLFIPPLYRSILGLNIRIG